MRFWTSYDQYLQRLAADSVRLERTGKRTSMLRSTGGVHIVCLPFFLLILVIPAVFDAMGWDRGAGWVLKILISVLLLVGMLYAGFRYMALKAQAKRASSE